MNPNINQLSPEQLEQLYPEIYNAVFPQIIAAVDEMIFRGQTPTPQNLSAIVDNIIINSDLWDEDDDEEVIPAQLNFGRRPGFNRPRPRPRRRHHNRNTLRDLVRILLLQEFFGGRNHFPRF